MTNYQIFWNDIGSKIFKNLNTSTGKEIYVAKICNATLINDFYKRKQAEKKLVEDTLYLDPNTKFFMAFIPQSTSLLINLFCCKTTMADVHNRLSSHGLALEGCFTIEPQTMLPAGMYAGYNIHTNKLFKSKMPSENRDPSYLVIDNHKLLRIMSHKEFMAYQPTSIALQYLQGYRLFQNGKPFIPLDTMKNISTNIPGLPNNIPGSNVVIDYENLKLKIRNREVNFSEIGSKVKFVYSSLFDMNNGLLVVSTDSNNNIMIIYHPKIDYFNMMLLLSIIGCKDAILVCNAPNANIMWKETGLNRYNKTDFMGNPAQIISNVITFSS